MKHVKKSVLMAAMLFVGSQAMAATYPLGLNPNPYNYSCKQVVPAVCATEADTPESLMHGPPVRPRYHFVRQGQDFCSGGLYYPLGFKIDTVPQGVEVPVVGLSVWEWGKLGWYPLIDYHDFQNGILGGIFFRDYWVRYYPCKGDVTR